MVLNEWILQQVHCPVVKPVLSATLVFSRFKFNPSFPKLVSVPDLAEIYGLQF